jgi:hypothetical protein
MTRRAQTKMKYFHLVISCLIVAESASSADITTLKGLKASGDVKAFADGMVTIATKDGPLSFSTKELASIDFTATATAAIPPNTKYDEIELIDGSILKIVAMEIPGKSVKPTFLNGAAPAVTLPIDNLFTLMRNAHDPKTREDWKKLLQARGKRDLFVIRQNDLLSPVPGTFLQGDGAGIDFERETDNQKVNFKLTRATGGLVFNQPSRGVIQPTLCRAYDTLGNMLTVQSLAIVAGEVKIVTVSGATFVYPGLTSLVKLDFSSGNVAYLSAMEPVVSAPMPAPGEPAWTFLRDKTPDGPGFKLSGVSYARGLWIAPDVSLTYKLNAEYREFKAIIGVDDTIPLATSAVRLTIDADGRALFTGTVSRKDKPRELTLDVKNVKVMKIVVEPEGLFQGNQINLAEAKLQK